VVVPADKSASDAASNAIDGLLAEFMEAIAKFKDTTALDASIIAGVQAVALSTPVPRKSPLSP
jgi:ferritin-like metal-binding protein YciE